MHDIANRSNLRFASSVSTGSGLNGTRVAVGQSNKKAVPFFLVMMLGTLWLMVLGGSWRLEQPSLAITLAVYAIVVVVGAGCIQLASVLSLIEGKSTWLAAFILKLTASFFTLKYFWVLPLGPNLRSVPPAAVTDSNLYDLEAKLLATATHFGAQHGLGLWLDYGILHYAATIYRIFGVSDLYIADFNAVLSLVGMIALTGTLKILWQEKASLWQGLKWAMFMPQVLFYEAIPAKEPLTNAAFYLAIYFLVRLTFAHKRKSTSLVGLVVCSAVLGAVRLNVLFLLITAFLAFIALTRQKPKTKVLTLGSLILLLALSWPLAGLVMGGQASSVTQIFDLSTYFTLAQTRIADRLAAQDMDPVGAKFVEAFLPHNIFEYIAYSPLKTAVWLYSPYPLVIPDVHEMTEMPELMGLDYHRYIGDVTQYAGIGSAIILIVCTPFFLTLLADPACRKDPRTKLLLTVFLVAGAIIASTQIIEYRRYRVLLEPMAIALALWGYAYRPRPPWRIPVLSVFGLGLVGFVLIKAIWFS